MEAPHSFALDVSLKSIVRLQLPFYFNGLSGLRELISWLCLAEFQDKKPQKVVPIGYFKCSLLMEAKWLTIMSTSRRLVWPT